MTGSCQRVTTLYVETQKCVTSSVNRITKKDVNTTHRQLRIMLAHSLAVVGLSWGLDQKRNGTELTLLNPTDPGTKLQNTWWWISQNPVTRYFVPPVPLRVENYDAKDMVRSLFTSTVVMTTSSWFSARLSLQISSVSTEQQQICARNYPKILELRWNLKQLIIWKRWKFLLALLLVAILRWNSSHLTQKKEMWCNIYAETTQCLEHENRPSLGHEKRLSPWRPIHDWSSGQISVSRQNRFLG